jgi:hypothetical protein
MEIYRNNKYLMILSFLLFFSCNKSVEKEDLIGSWYNMNMEANTYEEIHINETFIIWCYNACDIIWSYDYFIIGDSIYFTNDGKNICNRFEITIKGINSKKLHLVNNRENVVFIKMRKSFNDLKDYVMGEESLELLNLEYIFRRDSIYNSLN